MNEEAGWFDVELFADVFADFNQIMPALAAGARFRFVAMVDARQVRRQGITTAAFVRTWCVGGFLLLFQFGRDGGTIFVAGFDKQIALFGRQCFALAAETNALVVRQLKGKLLDLQLTPFEFGVALNELGIALGELALQGKNLRQDLFLSCEIDAIPCRRNAQVHEADYTIQDA